MSTPSNEPDRASRRSFVENVARSTAALALAPSVASVASANEAGAAKKKPVVDTHMHVWSEVPKLFPYAHPYNPNAADPKNPASLAMLLEDIDDNGVTHCIIVQTIFHGWDNDYVARCIKLHPKRFKGHGLIDPTDPKVADKLEYWVKEHGFAGMRFSAIYYKGKDDWMTSPAHHALWNKAEELGSVFNFFIAPEQLPKLEQMVRSHPAVRITIDHISQIDLGVKDPLPDMKKLLALSRYPNVWVKISELSSVSKSGKYPFPDAMPWVKMVYDSFGPDRLLWGTGYPGGARAAYKRPTLQEELTLVREKIPFLSDEDKDKMLGLNAAYLWNLDVT